MARPLRSAAAVAFFVMMAGCAAVHEPGCAPGEDHSISDVLYFGRSRASGVVTSDEWAAFLRTSVTPRFPAGLTVWPASGQWRNADGVIVREDSFVLTLLHRDDETSDASVRAIVGEYKRRFDQEAVLRVRSHTCVSF